jgi:hypothetical protein
MLAYAVVLGGLAVLLVASTSALREGIRRRGKVRGVVISAVVLLLSLLGIVAVLI